MTDEIIRFILSRHWSKHSAPRIAASIKKKFKVAMTARQVNNAIKKYTLRHHGEPVERKDWPCPK